MKKWILRTFYAFLCLGVGAAYADYTATQGTGSTVFAFVCFTTKICPAHVLTNSAGTEIGTSSNPVNASSSNTTATGNITTTQTVAITPTAGQASIGIQVTGTWTGTLFVEASVDGTNYSQTTIVPVTSGSVQTATITANGIWQANGSGFASFRIRGNTVASGTAVVTLIASTGTSTVMADNPFQVTGYTGMVPLNTVGNTNIGSATTDKPVMMGGSSTGASGGNAQVAKVDSSGTQFIDCSSSTNTLCGAINSAPTLGSASGGMTYKKLAALSNTAVAVDAAAGQLYELYCYNPNSSVAYVQVYDTAQASVTVGTTAAVLSYGIPATSSGGFSHSLVGIQFSTAITVAATTTAGGSTAPGTAIDCNAVYK